MSVAGAFEVCELVYATRYIREALRFVGVTASALYDSRGQFKAVLFSKGIEAELRFIRLTIGWQSLLDPGRSSHPNPFLARLLYDPRFSSGHITPSDLSSFDLIPPTADAPLEHRSELNFWWEAGQVEEAVDFAQTANAVQYAATRDSLEAAVLFHARHTSIPNNALQSSNNLPANAPQGRFFFSTWVELWFQRREMDRILIESDIRAIQLSARRLTSARRLLQATEDVAQYPGIAGTREASA